MGHSATSFDSLFFLAIFLCLPPVLLASRFFWRKPPWWVIIPLIVFVGWATYFLSVVTHFEHLQELVQSTKTPDQELLDQAYSEGAPLVFAAFMGWMVSLAYALPWLFLLLMATWLRSLIRRLRPSKR